VPAGGSSDDIADNNIANKELLTLFKKVNTLSTDKKKVVKEFIKAFVFKADVQQNLT
jgi:hypothetical protein